MPLSVQSAQKPTTVAQVDHRLHRSCTKLACHGKNCGKMSKLCKNCTLQHYNFLRGLIEPPPLIIGDGDSNIIYCFLDPQDSRPKHDVDPFSRFCTACMHDRLTDLRIIDHNSLHFMQSVWPNSVFQLGQEANSSRNFHLSYRFGMLELLSLV